jgi:hypothetical protein
MGHTPERDTNDYRRFARVVLIAGSLLRGSEAMLRAADIGPVQRPFRKASDVR